MGMFRFKLWTTALALRQASALGVGDGTSWAMGKGKARAAESTINEGDWLHVTLLLSCVSKEETYGQSDLAAYTRTRDKKITNLDWIAYYIIIIKKFLACSSSIHGQQTSRERTALNSRP